MTRRNLILVPLIALAFAGAGCSASKPDATTQPVTSAPETTEPTTVPADNNGEPMAQIMPSYSLAEVAAHKTETDCWTAIDGGVYDITTMLDKHPGGKEAAMRACGIDGSVLFNTRPTNSKGPHPAQAKDYLATMKIGILADEGAPQPQ